MRRRTAKLIRQTAKATGANYRALKQAFYGLAQKERHAARLEMKQAFNKKETKNETEKTEI